MPERLQAATIAAIQLRLAALLLALEALGDDTSADECIPAALGPTYRRTARCGIKRQTHSTQLRRS